VATGGDPIAFRVVMGGCLVTMLGAMWMLWCVRDPTFFSPRKIIAPALVIACGSFGGVYYWGAASPVAGMITYGIYFFSLGANARLTLALYLLMAGLHATMIGLITAGVIVDRGIISISHLRTIEQLGVLGVVEFLYFITFYTARSSQRVT